MVRVRENVLSGAGVWSDTLLWYARGVKKLKERSWSDRTSWRFLAGIHGFDPQRWAEVGAFTEGETPPRLADRRKFWQQCQHQTWYFLPWHRAYLAIFEAIIRDALTDVADFPSDWALPYWDYGSAGNPSGERRMPQAFAEPDWPDEGTNPLFESVRYGLYSDGVIRVTDEDASVEAALNEVEFSGTVSSASPGLGGPVSPFTHYGGQHFPATPNGLLEDQPHNTLHGVVGGSKGNIAGIMSDPTTAALDPIFWLHHANIDRLWEIWLRRTGSRGNPTSNDWLDGPMDRKFELPVADGGSQVFTARGVVDSQQAFDYKYENIEDPLAGLSRARSVAKHRGGVRPERGGGLGSVYRTFGLKRCKPRAWNRACRDWREARQTGQGQSQSELHRRWSIG
ncbi:hypothetical protein AJ87_07050 [Rhizobium yanglingense]|nr:hypothetical protein AJ87_07050 [Rhizobium yanglingense]